MKNVEIFPHYFLFPFFRQSIYLLFSFDRHVELIYENSLLTLSNQVSGFVEFQCQHNRKEKKCEYCFGAVAQFHSHHTIALGCNVTSELKMQRYEIGIFSDTHAMTLSLMISDNLEHIPVDNLKVIIRYRERDTNY